MKLSTFANIPLIKGVNKTFCAVLRLFYGDDDDDSNLPELYG